MHWALDKVKKNAAPGQDGVVVEMMVVDYLFEIWLALFQVCWKYGLVPSVWKESLVVPVPKKQAKGVCDVNNFRGISLTSTVSKVLCVVLNNRLSSVAEKEGLMSKEVLGSRGGAGTRC